MPQSVSIQTDNVVNTKPAKAREVSKDNTFSETLDKHINTAEHKPAESTKAPSKSSEASENKLNEQSDSDDKVTAEAEGQTEKTDADDGNKLPSDDQDSESDNAESNVVSSDTQTNVSVEPEQKNVVSVSASETKVVNSDNKVSTAGVAEKSVGKQAVAEPTTPNTTASTQAKSTNEASSESSVISKKQPDASLVTVTDTEKAVIKQTQHAAEGDKVPNFAKALQSMNEADGKTSEIRADIMDAINRQRQKVDGEQNMTVRNMIAAQTENKDRTEIDLSGIRADKTLQERLFGASPTTNTSTASSVASTSGSSPSASASAVASLPVQPNIQSSAWSQVMNSRVVWMAKEGIQQAEMKMNPANLGPVEVKLHVQNEQASVTFLAQHSTTRDALEQALPKLRESFAENGMQLTHAEVGQQQQQQQRDEQPQQMQNSQNFTQANRQSDDIMSEADETAGSVTQDSGLSLYV
nr:flagellar hook-length control protein FliK [uncultured Methylophaga sp.]